jgi:hypothetical protein
MENLFEDEFGVIYNSQKKSIVNARKLTNTTIYTVKEGTEIIEKECFSRCNLVEIYFPDSVLLIEERAFSGCRRLQKINLGQGLLRVKRYAFEHTSNLSRIYFPKCLKQLDFGALVRCSGKLVVSFDSENQYYTSDRHFVYTKEKIKITHVIDSYINKSVLIPNGVTEISESAFMQSFRVESVELADSVKSIGKFAFDSCGTLKLIKLSRNLIQIGECCFRYSRIRDITIPATVKKIGKNAFMECSNLISIKVDKENQHFKSVNHILYSKDLKTLIAYPVNIPHKKFKIPLSVSKIATSAFMGAIYLNEVKLNDNIEVIEEASFSDCYYLYRIGWSNKLRRVKRYAFRNCASLTSVRFPDTLEQIDENAFAFCPSLEYVYLPENVTSIKKEAFLNYQDIKFKIHKENKNFMVKNNRIYEKRENIHFSEFWFGGDFDPNAPF